MSDMKCPVCNVGYVHESVNHWCCDYEFCPSYDETDTETYDILIRTRKALEIAVDAIKNATEYLGNQEPLVDVMAMNLHTDLSKALEQITSLEQKD